MSVIDSKDLNDAFSTENGVLQGLRVTNRRPANEKNMVFNFDCVQFIADSFYEDTLNIGGVNYAPVQEQENLEQIFRVYDDVQVIGLMVDAWGIARPGLSGVNLETNNAPGGEPSKALSFTVKILGNYTNLDDERGYPAIYKSTEFNLVNDFNVVFSDKEAIAAPLATEQLGNNYVSNGEYTEVDTQYTQRMPSRQVFFPINEEGGTQMLHGGAEYILSLTPYNEKGVVQQGQDVPGPGPVLESFAYHMTTSVQVTLVCRVFRRRFG